MEEFEVWGIFISDMLLFNMVVVMENGVDYDLMIDE